MDLYPGNSLIEYLCNQGFNVFLLDWIPQPNRQDNATIGEQIFSYLLDAIKEILKASSINKINLAGYCQGGTYALILLYFYPELFKRAVLYNTPVDFSYGGLFQAIKFLPPSIFNFFSRKSIHFELSDVPFYPGDFWLDLKGWDCLEQTQESYKWFRAVNRWENDAVPMAKNALSQWIKAFYKENLMVKNRLSFGSRKVIIDDIKTPVLSIVAAVDDIAPRVMSSPIKNRLPYSQELCVPGGHLSTTAGQFACQHSWPATVKWFNPSS